MSFQLIGTCSKSIPKAAVGEVLLQLYTIQKNAGFFSLFHNMVYTREYKGIADIFPCSVYIGGYHDQIKFHTLVYST